MSKRGGKKALGGFKELPKKKKPANNKRKRDDDFDMMEVISGNNESKASNNRKKKQKLETDSTFVGSVTIKQFASHKKSFYFLEQLILKHKLNKKFKMELEEISLGLKFNFVNNDCSKFVDFLKNFLPIYQRKVKNVENQTIFKTEISPICRCKLILKKDDIICLHPKLFSTLGNIGPILICKHII